MSVYLGSDTYAKIEPFTQAIVIEGPRGGRDFDLRIPLANAENLAALIKQAALIRQVEDEYLKSGT